MITTRATLGLMLTLALTLAFAAPAAAGPMTLKGKVIGTDGQQETPLEYVKVYVTPIAPLKGKKEAPASDLVGVQITNPTGTFTIGELSSPSEGKEFPLMRNWRYSVEIEAAAHYRFEGEVEVRRKGDPLEFVLKHHDYEVVDDTGPVQENNTLGQRGIVRKP